jgi:hypothetical protein
VVNTTSLSTKPLGKDTCYCFGLSVGLSVDFQMIIDVYPAFFPGTRLLLVADPHFIRLEPCREDQVWPKRVISFRKDEARLEQRRQQAARIAAESESKSGIKIN